jgi:hypothetical protein
MTNAYPSLDGFALDPDAVHTVCIAYEEICRAMDIPDDATAQRNTIATRLIELVQGGEIDGSLLRDQVLREAHRAA